MAEDIVALAVRLLLAGEAPLWAVCVMALAAAVVLVLGRRAARLEPDPPPPPEVPSVWNQDPEQGAVVVPGPPGGQEYPPCG